MTHRSHARARAFGLGIVCGFVVTASAFVVACGGDGSIGGPAPEVAVGGRDPAVPGASGHAPSSAPPGATPTMASSAPEAGAATSGDAMSSPPTTSNVVTTPAPGGDVKWSCDFETSYCGMSEQSKIEPAHRSSFSAQARSGATSVALTTETGDDQVHGSGTWERDDLSLGPSTDYCNEGQEEWWAQSILFPDDYTFPAGPEAGILMDFHHNASSGQSNFEIQTIPGVGLRAEGHGGPQLNEGRYDFVIADPFGAPAGEITKNRWYDFVYHVKWSSSSDGFFIGWLNGEKVFEHDGATLYSGIACYFKLANYHAPFGTTSSVIHDRIVRGTTSAAVAIGALEGVP